MKTVSLQFMTNKGIRGIVLYLFKRMIENNKKYNSMKKHHMRKLIMHRQCKLSVKKINRFNNMLLVNQLTFNLL